MSPSFRCSRWRATRAVSTAQTWHCRFHSWQSTTTRRDHDSLRILFCGTDDFSVASLRALHEESRRPGSQIASIDVVTRLDKRGGRGLKETRTAPVKPVAQELRLPLHQIDTFTGWSPPEYGLKGNPYINLVIAVSFGLMVPPRILSQCKYGGINVHPSMLPDLRGAAPIQWAIMRGLQRTGISIQSLHPSKFDEGILLAQTPSPGIAIPPDYTSNELRSFLAPVGADMLADAIRKQLFKDPQNVITSNYEGPPSFAPKITTASRQINFNISGSLRVLRMNRAIPPLWSTAVSIKEKRNELRIIFGRDMRHVPTTELDSEVSTAILALPRGVPFSIVDNGSDIHNSPAPLFIKTSDDSIVSVGTLVVSGSSSRPAAIAAAKAGMFAPPTDIPNSPGARLYVFHEPLRNSFRPMTSTVVRATPSLPWPIIV